MTLKNWFLMTSACIHKQDLGKVLKTYILILYLILIHTKKVAIKAAVIGNEMEPEKRYSITSENSVSFQSILFVGDLLKRNTSEIPLEFTQLGIEKFLQKYKKHISRTNAKLLMSNRKSLLYYTRLSVSEGLDTETNKPQMKLERFNKDIFKKCRYCHHVFAIKKNFEKDKETCNACVKPLEKEVKISPSIYIFWRNNTKYRVFTDLHRSFIKL